MEVKALTVFAAGTLLLTGTGSVFAQDIPDLPVTMRPYIAESFNYTFADSSRHSDNGLGGYVGGGFPLNQYFNIEFGGAYSHFNHDSSEAGSAPWKEYQEQLTGQFFFSRNPVFSPYVGLTASHVDEVLKHSGKESAFATDGTIGAIHYFKFLNADFGFRASASWHVVYNNETDRFPGKGVDHRFGEPVLSVGLVIPIGFGHHAAEAAEPAPQAAAPPPPPPSDYPNRRYEDIHFAFDQSVLTGNAQSSLDADAITINKLTGKYPDLKIDLSGNTDWIGTDAYNQALSERRANAVRQYLTAKGVKSGNIRVHAYGESRPIAPNTTKAGRALNRRVEIKTVAP